MQFFFLDVNEELIGTMNDAQVCKVDEANYTAEMAFEDAPSVPFDDCASIGFEDIDGKLVFYEVVDTYRSDFDGIVHFSCEHAAMSELLDEVITGKAVSAEQAGRAVARVVEGTRWELLSAETTPVMSTSFWYTNVWNALERIRDATDCALYFEWRLDGNTVSKRYITVKARAGENRGKRFDLTKDLTSIEVHMDKSSIYTRLYGRGRGEEVGTSASGETTYGRRTTFSDVEWSIANGDPMDKPLGQEYLEDAAATESFGRGPVGAKRPRQAVIVYEDCEDPETLLQLTYEKLVQTRYPILTISAKVIDLERVWGRTYEAVRMGDDVTVIVDDWNATYHDRVVKIVRDYLNEFNTEITIGQEGKTSYGITSDLSSQLSKVKERAEIGSNVAAANPKLLQGIIDTMATHIMSSGTGITTDPDDGSLVFTASDGSSAVKLTGAGILISNERVADRWVWKTALSGDGIVTQELTAGVIQASLIKIFGTEQFYWDSSNIYIQNPDDTNQQIRIGLYDGEHYGIAFTRDGGVTWQNAIGFDGVHFSGGDVSGIHIGATAPENPQTDDVWLDVTSIPNTFKRWDGTSWVECGQEFDIDAKLSEYDNSLREYLDKDSGVRQDLDALSKTVAGVFDYNEKGEVTFLQKIYEAIDASNDVPDDVKTLLRYVRIVNGNIVLGELGNEITATIQHNRISFQQSGVEVAYISDKMLYIKNAIVQPGGYLQIGDFGFVPETEDRSVSFLKISGE